MLRFQVFLNGHPATAWPIRNAYLLGADGNPVRSEIRFASGAICCENREGGNAALVLQQNTGGCGVISLQTCLLPDRDEPYLLNVELARHRLLVLYHKLEDWAMFDLGPSHPVTKRTGSARKRFIEAICWQQEHPARSDKLGRESLVAALNASEELALAHADLLLQRRMATGAMPRRMVGCGLTMSQPQERIRSSLLATFDYVILPIPWQQLAPEEGEYRWDMLDQWAQWLQQRQMPVVGGPLVSFQPGMVPDWLFIWEHDFGTVRDLMYEHIEQVVARYRQLVTEWIVVSGLHVNNHPSFSFDQIIELTRMSGLLVRDLQPEAKVWVQISHPFGEYYSHNQQSIPPLTYADLLVQSQVPFDGFNIKLFMGQPAAGQHTRDLLQVSNLLDQFAQMGKPICLTVAVPSEPVPASRRKTVSQDTSGHWRKPWSQVVQARWLTAVLRIALSKPFTQSVAWGQMVDHPDSELPASGLIDQRLEPKGAYRRLVAYRRLLTAPPVIRPDAEMPDSASSAPRVRQNPDSDPPPPTGSQGQGG